MNKHRKNILRNTSRSASQPHGTRTSVNHISLNPIVTAIRNTYLPAGVLLGLHVGNVMAGPDGGNVVGGAGTISTPDANTTVINQTSQNLAIDWQTFNVAKQELVKYIQPNISAEALNRIFDQNPSQIFGRIEANGRVILVNPNGVFFKPGAQVNVNALIASAHNVSVQEFMDGKLNFTAPEGGAGMVVNQGLIQAATGGDVSLIGGAVSNEGMILATAGQVNMVAGDQITVDFDGDGLIQFSVDKEVIQNAQNLDAAVSNTGTIDANGGMVLLAGKAAKDVFTNVVNNEGIVKAGRIENKNGKIRLVGMGAGSSIINTGTLNVAATESGVDGGTIDISADNVTNTGTLDAGTIDAEKGTIDIQTGVSGEGSQSTFKGEYIAQSTTVSGGAGDDVFVYDASADATLDGQGGSDDYAVTLGAEEQTVIVDDTGTDDGFDTGHWKTHAGDDAPIDSVTYAWRPGDETGKAGLVTFEDGEVNQEIEFSGLEPINVLTAAATINVTGSVAGETITVTSGTCFGGVGACNATTPTAAYVVDFSSTVEDVAFIEQGILNINAGDGNDIININITTDLGGATNVLATINANGQTGNDSFNLSANAPGSVVNFNGGAGTNNVFNGPDAASTWTINAANSGSVTGTLSANFTSIHTINAGTAVDMFNITAAFDGTINGGTGADTFTLASDLAAGGVINGGADGDSFNINTTLTNATLNGDAGNDTFTLDLDTVTVANTLNGGANTDTIVNTGTAAATWDITGVNQGCINSAAACTGADSADFAGVESLSGGSMADTFIFAAAGSLGGLVDGNGGVNTLDYSSFNSTIDVTLTSTGASVGFAGDVGATIGTFDDITNITGDSVNTNSLTGLNSGTFNITATNNYMSGGRTLTFTALNDLTGGNGVDTFNITMAHTGDLAGGGNTDNFFLSDTIMGSVDGGVGADFFALTRTASVTGTLTGGSGGADNDTLIGPSTTAGASNTWAITMPDQGTVNGQAFVEMENLFGGTGTGTDTFDFSAAGSISQQVFGNGGAKNILDYADYGSAISVTLSGLGTNIGFAGDVGATVGSFDDITNVAGNTTTTTDALTGLASGTFNITATNNYMSGARTLTFTDLNDLTGGTDADMFNLTMAHTGDLDGDDGTNTYNISAALSGNITGGTGTDKFVIDDGGSVSGTINGGTVATNTLNYSNVTATTVAVNLQTGAASKINSTGASGFTNIQTFVGGGNAGNDTLTGANTTNAWSVTGTAAGTINATITFSSFEAITGGTMTDTLTGPTSATTYNITAADAGCLNDAANCTATPIITYSSIENLVGGSMDDVFNISADSTLASSLFQGGGGDDDFNINVSLANTQLDGDSGNDTFTLAGGVTVADTLLGDTGTADTVVGPDLANAWSVTATGAGSIATGATASFSGIEALAGGTMTDTLTGPAGATTYNITAANAGCLNDAANCTSTPIMTFTGIENLTGGVASDVFRFFNAGTLDGTIDGGPTATNTLNYSNVTATTVAVNLQTSAASKINSTGASGFTNIQTFVGGGNAGNDTLTGANTTNAWSVTGTAAGTINATITFSSFEAITGGTMTDTLTGPTSATTYNITAADAGCLNDAANCTATPIITYSSIENLIGQGNADVFNIGADSGLAASLFQGGGGDDDFNINVSLANTQLDGDSGNDTFTLAGGVTVADTLLGDTGTADTVVGPDLANAWTLTMAGAGSIATGATASFSGIETLTGGSMNDTFSINGLDNVTSANITGGGGATDTLTIDDSGDGGSDTYSINATSVTRNTAAESITYAGIEQLNLSVGAGDDMVTVDAADATPGPATPAMFIDGGAGGGSDTLVVNGLTAPVTKDKAGATTTLSTAAENDVAYRQFEVEPAVSVNLVINDSMNNSGTFEVFIDGAGNLIVEIDNVEQANEDISNVLSLTLNGGNMNDVFNITYNNNTNVSRGDQSPIPDGGITINGETGTDTFNIVDNSTGGSALTFTSITHELASATSGSIIENIAGTGTRTISYATLEGPINDPLNATTRVFNFNGGSETVTFADDAGATDSFSSLDSTLSPVINFRHPVTNLTIDVGGSAAGSDMFTLNALDAAFVVPNLDIDGGTSSDIFTINATPGSLTMTTSTIDGENGTDQFVFNNNAKVSAVIGATGDDVLDFSANTTSQTFNLTGSNDGCVNNALNCTSTPTTTFTGIAVLKGGTASDIFDLNSNTLSGSITDAGGTNDTIMDGGDINLQTAASSLVNSGAGGGIPTTIETFTNAGTGTITGKNATQTWTITGAGGSVGGVSFSGFDTLQGGSLIDTFDISGSDATTIMGGLQADVFNINGVTTVDLAGEGGNDDFDFAGAVLTGSVDGGGGSDEIIDGGDINLENQTSTLIGGGNTWTSIETFTNGGTITGPNSSQTWSINGTGTSNTVAGFNFTGFATIQGGTDVDTFNISGADATTIKGGAEADVFNINGVTTVNLEGEDDDDDFDFAAAILTGSVDGGTGSNEIIDGGDIHLGNQTSSLIGGANTWTSIQTFTNGGTLTGPAGNQTWTLSANDKGTVAGFNFSNFTELHGNTGNDIFDLAGFSLTVGQIRDDGGTEELIEGGDINLATFTSSVIKAGAANGFSGIETFTNGGTLTGPTGGQSWNLTAAGGSLTSGYSFSGFTTLQGNTGIDIFNISDTDASNVRGGAGNDTFTLSTDTTANLFGETGNDNFFIIANLTGAIDGGGGQDDFNFSASVTISGGVTGGTENDNFFINNAVDTGAGSLAGGVGDDHFFISADVTGALSGGGGTDTFDFNVTSTISKGVDGGANNDIFNINTTVDTGTGSLAGGPGNDTFNINADVTGDLNGQGGSDTFNFSSSSTITGAVDGGSNNDVFNFKADLTVTSITGGDDDDDFNFNTAGVTVSTSVSGGNGSDDFNVTKSVTIGPTGTANLSGDAGNDNFNINFTNATQELAANLIGGANNDTFTFIAKGRVAGNVDGTTGAADLLDFSGSTYVAPGNVLALTLGVVDAEGSSGTVTGSGTDVPIRDLIGTPADNKSFDNIDSIAGNGGAIVGPTADTWWDITMTDKGTFGPSLAAIANTTFDNFSIIARTGVDTFIFQAAGEITGGINGGGGSNILAGSSGLDEFNITGLTTVKIDVGNTNTGTTTLLNIVNINGTDAADTGADIFNVTMNWGGNLRGIGGNDTFNISANVAGLISGGSGTDTFNFNTGGATVTGAVTGDDDDDTFNINASAVAGLQGNAGNDSFVFGNGNVLTGTINGGADTTATGDTISWLAYTTPRTITINANAADGFSGSEASVSGGFSNIDSLVGGTMVDSITGQNVAATWGGVGGANNVATYTIGANVLNLSRIETFNGGSGIDTFNLTAVHTGDLNGGAGNDIFNMLAGSGLASTIGGQAGNDKIAGTAAFTYTLSAPNAGTVNSGVVTAFNSIEFLDSGSVNCTGACVINVNNSGGTGFIGINNITTIDGTGLNTQTVQSNTGTWDFTGVGDLADDGLIQGVTFTDFGRIDVTGVSSLTETVADNYNGVVNVSANGVLTWNYAQGKTLGSSVTGPGAIDVANAAVGADITIDVTDLDLSNFNLGGGGHLVVGGTLDNYKLPVAENATVINVNVSTITVDKAISVGGGGLTLLAGQLDVNQNTTAGDDVFFLASNTLAGGGNSQITFAPTAANFAGDSVVLVAEDTINGLGNVFFGVNSLQVLVDTAKADSVGNPAGGTGTTEPDPTTTDFATNILGLTNVAAATITFFNPATALIGLQDVAFVDVGLFEEELTLFGIIGNGIALSLAQCEEVEGCAPNVTEEELAELIASLEGRIADLERRLADEKDSAERKRLEDLIAGYKAELENFRKYQKQLQEFFAAGEEEIEEETFEEEEIPAGPPDVQTVETLADMLKVVNARIQWLESLKDDPTERARLSEITGIELTQEALDAIIEGAKSEAGFIENQLKLLLEGKEALREDTSEPVFTAEARDYDSIMQVAYGPSLLDLTNQATTLYY